VARHYSPKAFMIEAPNRLLKEYFERAEVSGDIPWQHLSDRDIKPIFEAYENAPEKTRRRMDEDFSANRALYQVDCARSNGGQPNGQTGQHRSRRDVRDTAGRDR